MMHSLLLTALCVFTFWKYFLCKNSSLVKSSGWWWIFYIILNWKEVTAGDTGSKCLWLQCASLQTNRNYGQLIHCQHTESSQRLFSHCMYFSPAQNQYYCSNWTYRSWYTSTYRGRCPLLKMQSTQSKMKLGWRLEAAARCCCIMNHVNTQHINHLSVIFYRTCDVTSPQLTLRSLCPALSHVIWEH